MTQQKFSKITEFPFSVQEIDEAFQALDDTVEIEIVETIRVKPTAQQIKLQSVTIDLSLLEVDRVKPMLTNF